MVPGHRLVMDPDIGRKVSGHLISPCHFIDGDIEAFSSPGGTRMAVWQAQIKDWKPGRDSKGPGLNTTSGHVHLRDY